MAVACCLKDLREGRALTRGIPDPRKWYYQSLLGREGEEELYMENLEKTGKNLKKKACVTRDALSPKAIRA